MKEEKNIINRTLEAVKLTIVKYKFFFLCYAYPTIITFSLCASAWGVLTIKYAPTQPDPIQAMQYLPTFNKTFTLLTFITTTTTTTMTTTTTRTTTTKWMRPTTQATTSTTSGVTTTLKVFVKQLWKKCFKESDCVMTVDCQPVNKKYINETGNPTLCRRAVGCVPQYDNEGLTTYSMCKYVNRW